MNWFVNTQLAPLAWLGRSLAQYTAFRFNPAEIAETPLSARLVFSLLGWCFVEVYHLILSDLPFEPMDVGICFLLLSYGALTTYPLTLAAMLLVLCEGLAIEYGPLLHLPVGTEHFILVLWIAHTILAFIRGMPNTPRH